MPASPRVRIRTLAAGLACLLVATAALTGCSNDDGSKKALETFLTGWRTGKLDRVGFIAPTGEKIPAGQVADQIRALSGELRDTPPSLHIDGDPKIVQGLATAHVKVDWTLPGGHHWIYSTTVRLKQSGNDWAVIWEPAVVQADLETGDEFAVRRVTPARAAILDGAGQPIIKPRPVVIVGVQPNQVADVTDLVEQLHKAFARIKVDIDLSDLPARLKAAKPGAFVEVVALRQADYEQIRGQIHPLPGTKFIEETWDLAPTRQFARALLGTVGDATKEDLDSGGGRYQAGDKVGHGGLEERYDERLRGTPGERVLIERKAPDGTVSGTEIHRAEPGAGSPVRTTLDPVVQQAADAALAAEKRTAAVVAVRVGDGAVLAAANGPDGGTQNVAFTAQVPPGSTFKMVTALGLLDEGAVSLDGTVECPSTITVGGQTFKNSHNFALGAVPFRTDFARSCNTAFASLADKLGPDGLARAAAALGIGGGWDLGLDAFTGAVSSGGTPAEQAMAAFGQGTTQVSPLAMAAATAAVARGQWQQPHLLADPAPASPAAPGPRLKPDSIEPLRTMMREVVTKGTGAALADLPGPPVYGKTGTAEYDNDPAHAHAWFVGWQGEIAFAVFIENGGDSTTSSVPLTERFLRGLN